MNKRYIFLIPVLGLMACSAWLLKTPGSGGQYADLTLSDRYDDFHYKKAPKEQRFQGAVDYRKEQLKNAVTGEFDVNDYYRAVEQANALKRDPNYRGGLNLQWTEMGPDNVGGRTRAVLVDNVNSDIVYAGGVSGGFWVSENSGSGWELRVNGMEFLTVVSMAQASDGTLYVGTGETILGSNVSTGVGNGIYKSSDKGMNWESITSTRNWTSTSRIAIDPNDDNHIFAATTSGLQESNDGGDTWSQVQNGLGYDVKFNADGSAVFATVSNRLYRSLNGGPFALMATQSSDFPGATGRVEIGVAASDPNYIYASVVQTNSCLQGIYQTKDKGDNWTLIGPGGSSTFDPFSHGAGSQFPCQGGYDNGIGVNPADPGMIYVGGITLWTWSEGTGWKRANFNFASVGSPKYIHSDIHGIVFDPRDPEVMYVHTDGGIHKSTNAMSGFPFPDFSFKNQGYNTVQFYGMAASVTGEVMGGTQDNGTILVDFTQNTEKAGTDLLGGDGGYASMSKINRSVFVGTNPDGPVYRSGNAGASFSCFYDEDIDSDGDCSPDCGGLFVGRFWLHETFEAYQSIDSVDFTADRDYASGEKIIAFSETANYPIEQVLAQSLSEGQTIRVQDIVKSYFFLATPCGLWMTPDLLDLSDAARWYRLTTGGTPGAVATSPDLDIVYVGVGSQLLRLEGLTRTDYTKVPGQNWNINQTPIQQTTMQNSFVGSISGIDVDENDPDHILVGVQGFGSNRVWVSQTGNPGSWNSVSNNLPDIPVYDVAISQANSAHYILATELGIWASADNGASWSEQNNGISRVPVFALPQVGLYHETCPVLYAGTHGRGFFRSVSLTPGNCDTVPGGVGILPTPELNSALEVKLYPNPVSETANVEFELNENSEVQLIVVDLKGSIVISDDLGTLSTGQHKVTFDAYDLTAGTYVLAINANGKVQSKQFHALGN